MSQFAELHEALEQAGFTHADDLKAAHEERATKNGMHNSGPYVVHHVWTKGLLSIVLEQNTCPDGDETSGLSALVTHPPVCVVTGPGGRCAVSPNYIEGVLTLAEDLA